MSVLSSLCVRVLISNSPPPLQTRRAAKAAAQANAPPIQEAPQPEATKKPERPQPRPLPPGLRLSPDSDDGFVIPKHRAKVARALERFRAEDQSTNSAAPSVPATHVDGRTGVHIPANSRKSKASPPAPSVSHPATSFVAIDKGPTGPLQQGATASGAAVQRVQELPSAQSQPHSIMAQPATQSLHAVRPVPQKPASVVSPGGRHYSGLFPSSVTLTGPGVLPPGASRYSARLRSTSPISAPHSDDPMLGLQSGAKSVDGDNANVDEDIDAMGEPSSSSPPIQPPSDPDEAHIIRLCIRHGLDPHADYSKMARAYVAAMKKHQAEEEEEEEGLATTNHDDDEGDAANNPGNGDSNNVRRSGGGCTGRGGEDDGDGDDSGDDDGDGEDDEDEDDRYGPEYDAWMIDPDTDNNQHAPCAYNFQTRSCAMRYYGPPPEFVGSNGEVERYTTYRWNDKPGAFQRIGAGFIAPRASIWQLADARREADRQRTELIAAGLIQPHRDDDDDDSGSDYGTTQQELKTRGKPVDSDLERESDVSSPVKSNDKGKGRELPAVPLTNKGKARAEPAIPFSLAQLDDKEKQQNLTATGSAGTGGRPSLAELAMCDALGIKVHKSVTDIGLMYGRRPEVILARLGLAPAPTRHQNIWNAFQTWLALRTPDVPHDGKPSASDIFQL